MLDATIGVLGGVVLIAYGLIGWHGIKACWAGEYGRGLMVAAMMWTLVLGAFFPMTLALATAAVLLGWAFLTLLVRSADRPMSFWDWWCLNECLKCVGHLLVAVLVALFGGKDS